MKSKKHIALGCILVAIVLAFTCLLVTVPLRVEGVWQADVGYLKAYERECVNTFILNEDGTFLNVVSDVNTEEILKTSAGTWHVSGLEVNCRRLGQNGSTPFTYNPVTNKLNNGGGLFPANGDVIFYKVP